jgi:hypothetical protein
MEVPRRQLGSGERPLALAAPLVRPEHVELERRTLVPAVVELLEEPVVEGQVVVADHGHSLGEVDIALEGLDLLLV